MSPTEFLNKQVHCLNHKYASLKFTEFTEKLWLKQKLQKIHSNLLQAGLSQNKQTRQDAYMSVPPNYSQLTIVDLINKVKQQSKRLLETAP